MINALKDKQQTHNDNITKLIEFQKDTNKFHEALKHLNEKTSKKIDTVKEGL